MKERDGPMQKAGKSLGMAHRAKLLRVLYLDKYGIEQERPDLESGLRYVYIANFPGHERENTYCPNCNGMVIARFGYDIHSWNLDNRWRSDPDTARGALRSGGFSANGLGLCLRRTRVFLLQGVNVRPRELFNAFFPQLGANQVEGPLSLPDPVTVGYLVFRFV